LAEKFKYFWLGFLHKTGSRIEDRNHPSSIFYRRLVPEVPHAGENHRYAMLVGGGDDFVVLD
jgi:hypothetical protein